MKVKPSIEAIDRSGILLVFPIQNRKEPPSLWTALYPRTVMRWEWDDSADSRVANHWHLREHLSRSGEVAYGKWYQNRATLFSLPVFSAAIHFLQSSDRERLLSPGAKKILSYLEQDSPESTKQLKKNLKAEGVDPKSFDKHMKELWELLLIVGFGEVDDGAFPSLAVGATRVLFEEEWREAMNYRGDSEKFLREKLGEDSPFWKLLVKIKERARVKPAPKKKVVTFKELTARR